MKILITGGAGYRINFGSRIDSKNYTVTVVDNFMFKQSSLNHLCTFENFNIINGDISDHKLIEKLLKNHDLITFSGYSWRTFV